MTYAIQVVGLAVLVYGLVQLDLLAVVSGLVILQTAKAWFIDRMVLLFEHMKAAQPRRTPPGSTERASTRLPYFGSWTAVRARWSGPPAT